MSESKWKYHGIRIVRSSELDANTAQTPGMNRAAAISHARCGAEKLWAGTVVIHAKAKTGAHHHGPVESVIYVVSGKARMRWGDRLRTTILRAGALRPGAGGRQPGYPGGRKTGAGALGGQHPPRSETLGREKSRHRLGPRKSFSDGGLGGDGPPDCRERRRIIELDTVAGKFHTEALPQLRKIGRNRCRAHFVVQFDQHIRAGGFVAHPQRAPHIPGHFDIAPARDNGAQRILQPRAIAGALADAYVGEQIE